MQQASAIAGWKHGSKYITCDEFAGTCSESGEGCATRCTTEGKYRTGAVFGHMKRSHVNDLSLKSLLCSLDFRHLSGNLIAGQRHILAGQDQCHDIDFGKFLTCWKFAGVGTCSQSG
jgi:hypothetical protein